MSLSPSQGKILAGAKIWNPITLRDDWLSLLPNVLSQRQIAAFRERERKEREKPRIQ